MSSETRGHTALLRRDVILIGSTSRDCGKTEFACALIARYAPLLPVVGVKVTRILETGGVCPRGGPGCGVCVSLDGAFSITEERDATLSKDTSRMVRAGAHSVLWLRVRQEHLREGVEALFDEIKTGRPVICESNAVRSVLEPSLFLMLHREGSTAIKLSARERLPLVDRLVSFRGNGWDLAPEMCTYRQGIWSLPPIEKEMK